MDDNVKETKTEQINRFAVGTKTLSTDDNCLLFSHELECESVVQWWLNSIEFVLFSQLANDDNSSDDGEDDEHENQRRFI